MDERVRGESRQVLGILYMHFLVVLAIPFLHVSVPVGPHRCSLGPEIRTAGVWGLLKVTRTDRGGLVYSGRPTRGE